MAEENKGGYNCGGLIMQAVWGALFFVFSTNENRYGSDGCGELREVGYLFSIFCFSSLVALCCFLLPYSSSPDCQKNSGLIILNGLITFALLVGTLGFLIAMTIAYSKGEPCNQLTQLALAYIIINYFFYGILVLILLVVGITFCCSIISINAQQQQNQNDPNQENLIQQQEINVQTKQVEP